MGPQVNEATTVPRTPQKGLGTVVSCIGIAAMPESSVFTVLPGSAYTR